jgi:AraC-like DNA-binding protein
MSGAALKWVFDQEGSGPGMQALLMVLALSATDPSQLCELSLADLARQTRQSRRSVSRLLAELEGVGVIERDDRWAGDGGRQIVARLRLDRSVRLPTVEERHAARPELDGVEILEEQKDNAASEGGLDNFAGGGSRQIMHQVSPNSAPGQDKFASPPLYTNLEESLSSAREGAREGERERNLEFQKRLRADWGRFAAVYPGVEAMDLARGEEELGRLKLGERDAAIREAAHYAAAVKAAKKSFPKEAWRWVADRDFERLAAVRAARGGAGGGEAGRVTVKRLTPAGRAWDAYDRGRGKVPGFWFWSDQYGCEIGLKPALFPPGGAGAPAPAEAATGPPGEAA